VFVRIFLLFWLAMALIVGASIAITYSNAAREYDRQEFQRRPPVAFEASEALAGGGVRGLKKWLAANQDSVSERDLFIVGQDGVDMLGRRLSESAMRRLEFFNHDTQSGPEQRPPEGAPPTNFRPMRQAPQIVAADGTSYTILVVPRRPSIFGALSRPGIPLRPRRCTGCQRACQLVACQAFQCADQALAGRSPSRCHGITGPARQRGTRWPQ